MSISFEKLISILQERGITPSKIRENNIMSQSAWQKIRTGTGKLDTATIDHICRKLNVQPGDIMEWVDDGKGTHGQKNK